MPHQRPRIVLQGMKFPFPPHSRHIWAIIWQLGTGSGVVERWLPMVERKLLHRWPAHGMELLRRCNMYFENNILILDYKMMRAHLVGLYKFVWCLIFSEEFWMIIRWRMILRLLKILASYYTDDKSYFFMYLSILFPRSSIYNSPARTFVAEMACPWGSVWPCCTPPYTTPSTSHK